MTTETYNEVKKSVYQPNVMTEDVVLEMLQHLCDVTSGYKYIIDFEKHRFFFIDKKFIHAWGLTVDKHHELGYEYFSVSTHPDDREMMDKMRRAVTQKMREMGENIKKISYFSFRYRILSPLCFEQSEGMRVNLKMSPMMFNGRVRFGVVEIQPSVFHNSGELRMHYRDSGVYELWDPNSGEWSKAKKPHLDIQEQHILFLVRLGYDFKNIADKMNLSETTVRNITVKMYRKLGVSSVTQAVLFAVNYSLLYVKAENRITRRSSKRGSQRVKLTPETLEAAQHDWNIGWSINAIAKHYGISEGAIRYAIRKGKLKSPPRLQEAKNEKNSE